jgi:amino acid adenylation domain-containing protein
LLLHSWGQIPLQLFVRDFHAGADVRIDFVYNQAYFTAEEIRALQQRLRIVLESAVSDPQRTVATWPILPPAERQLLLRDWNATEAEYPKDQCIHQLVEAQAERTTDSIALVFEEQSLSYGELNARANRLAHHLITLGIRPDDRVAIGVARCLEMIVGLLAILKAGGAYVPLDPAYPEDRLAFMVEDSGPVALLVHGATRDRFAGLAGAVPMIDLEADAAAWAELSATNPDPYALGLGPNHLAYIIYTSGSTGKPKGVMVEHHSLVNLVFCHLMLFERGDVKRVLQFASLSFDVASWEIFTSLSGGDELHMASVAQIQAGVGAVLKSKAITHAAFTPSMLAVLEQESLPNLVCLTVGGEACTPAQVLRWARGRRLVNAYGPTEATVCTTVYECRPDGQTQPIGRPLPNTRVYVLDGDGEPVPVGVAGEMHIGGAGVARGYLNLPELTAERFLPDPYAAEPEARMYRTGDLARWLPNGVLQFLGRIDDQVKLRGFRIELGEIEERLTAHDAVREAVVVVWPGEGNPRLGAYVTADDSADAATLPTLLRDHLRTCLPDYMVPASIQQLESLPLTPNGKVDRKALPAPQITRTVNGAPPATATEELLAGLWTTLLEHEAIGRDDDFFVLGGHSLLATQLVARIRTQFQRELTVRTVFERPRLAELAEAIDQAAGGVLPPPITPQPAATAPSLSFAQQRLWFLAQWEEDASATYNMPLGLRLEGTLDIAALRSSLVWLLERHETLRTCFPLLNGEASVEVRPVDSDGALNVRDWRRMSAEVQHRDVERIANAYAVEPFNLGQGPLFKAELLVLADDRHVLLLNMHHIVGDGWSWGVLMRDLGHAYGAFAAGQQPAAASLQLRYSDYAAWQRQWLQGGALETQAAYWANQLAQCPTLLELPTDRPRPARQSFRGARHDQVLPTALAAQLQRLGRTHSATLFMTLLATFNVLLWRHSGQDDLCIGTPIAGRTHHQTEGLVGMFVNTLVLRTRLDPEQSFSDLLNNTRDTCLTAYTHQDLPFEALVERLQPQRSLSHSPLFQVMFALQSNQTPELSLPALAVEPLPLDCPVAKFDLTLDMEERDGHWHGAWEYAADLFDPETIKRLAVHYQELLEAVALNPGQRIGDLPLLSGPEQQQLRDWNQTATVAPCESTLVGLFERQVEQTPDNIALEFEEQTYTYAELNARANRVAHHLLALETADHLPLIRPDTRVAIAVERSLEMMVGLLGILKAGAAYVPIDPNSPEERRRHQLEDCGAPVLLTQARLQGHLQQLETCRVIGLETIALSDHPATNPPPQSRPDSLAYVIYTSGSTGKPKGVMVEHLGVAAHCAHYRERHGLSAADRVLPMAAFYFDASVEQLFPVLLAGGQLLLTEFDLEPIGFARQIKTQGITLLDVSGVYWRALVQTWIAQPELAEGSPLRTLIVGGDVMPVDVLRLWRQTPLSRTVRLFNVYGPTETTVAATVFEVPLDFDADRPRIPIGKPLANRQVHVLDRRRQPVPVGVPGELYIGGSGLARGYLNQHELTQEKFVCWGERLYRTGDRACWLPDGNLDFLGRLDHQVKLRGYRVELGEIEARLKQLNNVEDAAAVVHEEGSRQVLVAYLAIPPACGRAADLNREVIQAALRNSLPGYMVPARFIVVEAIPRLSASGKVDKAALPSPALSQPAETLAPRTPMEEAIAAIWCSVLERTAVGIQDNFFELGGHSLLATQVISRINQAFMIKLPLQRIFEYSTIEDLAKAIERYTLARDMFIQPSPVAPPDAASQSANDVEVGEL